MSNEQYLMDVLGNYHNESYFVGHAIPTKKLQNVLVEFPIPSQEKIIAIIDGTVWGSSKIGLAFGLSAIYSKNDWTVDSSYREGYISYEDFKHSNVSMKGKDIFLGGNCMVNLTGSQMKPKILVQILYDLQHSLRTLSPSQAIQNTVNVLNNVNQLKAEQLSPLSVPVEEFMVAKDGQQFGPYSVATINNMIQSEQLDAKNTYLWKQGMAQWELISHRKEFANVQMTPPQVPSPIIQPEHVFLEIPFDINVAQEHDLLTLPGVNIDRAHRVLDYRRYNGQITTYEKLHELLSLKPHEFEIVKSLVKDLAENASVGSGRVIDF